MTDLVGFPNSRAMVDGRMCLGLRLVCEKGAEQGNAQFIEAGQGCSEFKRKEAYCGIEMSHRSLPNVELTEGKV
jgi:hypothetical protein